MPTHLEYPYAPFDRIPGATVDICIMSLWSARVSVNNGGQQPWPQKSPENKVLNMMNYVIGIVVANPTANGKIIGVGTVPTQKPD